MATAATVDGEDKKAGENEADQPKTDVPWHEARRQARREREQRENRWRSDVPAVADEPLSQDDGDLCGYFRIVHRRALPLL